MIKKIMFRLVLVLTLGWIQAEAFAADGIWTNNASGNWSVGSNWTNGIVADGVDATATLDNVITATCTITLDSNRTIGNIKALDTSNDYIIGGTSTLTLDVTSGSPIITNVSGRTLTISCPIGGNDGLTINGASTVALSGVNNYSGGTVLNGGTVNINNASALGGSGNSLTFGGTTTLRSFTGPVSLGALTINSGVTATLNDDGNGARTFTFASTSGSGTFAYMGAYGNTYNLGNASAFTGNIYLRQISSGTSETVTLNSLGDATGSSVQFSHNLTGGTTAYHTLVLSGDSGSLTFNNRQIQILPSQSGRNLIVTLANNNSTAANKWVINTDLLYTEVAGTAARTFDLAGSNSGNNEFHGSIGNSTNGSVLALTKSGNGTWILSGTNTYSGSTTISAGRLEISGVLGGGTNYIGNIANAGTLIVSGSSTQTWSGVVSGNGTFIKDGSGTLTLSGINTFPVLRTTNGVTRFTRVEAIIPTAANYLYTGGMNDLAFSGSTVISSLYLNNVSQPAGVYNASSHPAFFSGSGSLIIGRPTALTWASTSSGSVGYWTNSLWSPTPSGGLLYPAYYKEDANLTNAIASGAYTVIYDSTLPNELDDVVLSNSGAGTAVLVVTNSTLRASTLIGPGSRLQIENGGVVSSYYVSTENMFAGTNGVLSISSGGIFDVTTSAYIGNAVINVRGTVNVSAGGVMKSGDLTIGYGIGTTATNNSLIVSGGGVVSNAAVYVGYGSGGAGTASGNRLTVSNATVNMSGALMIAHAGNSTINNMMTVDQGGVVNMGLNTLTVCGTADYGFPVYGTNNGLIITNNGMVRCGSVTINGSESYYGNLWINNGGSLVSSNATCAGNIQINGGVNVSTWNLTTNTLAINSKSGVMRVDGSGVVGGAVVANVGLLQLNNTDPSYTARLILTNGAAMSATSLWISTQNAPAGYNALSVIGGAASSVLSLAGSDVNVGVALDGGNTKNSLGTLTIAGGVVTNAGALKVGTRLAGGGYGEAGANTVYITDGGKLYTTNTSYIGYNSGSGDGVRLTHNNKMFVSGSGSLWDANGRNVTVGGSGGSNPPTNCVLSVSSGGQVLNVGVLAIGTGSAVDNILALNPAGLVSATSATIRASNALEVVLNNAISTQAGRLDVSGNLNISNSKLNITIVGNPTANAIIATYGSLTGAFAVTNGLPDKYRLDMHYQNQNQIAIVYTAAGTVIHFR